MIRIVAIVGLLVLAVAGCSSEDASLPVAAPASASAPVTTTSSSAAKKCSDFATVTYLNAPAFRADEIEKLGWKVDYADYDGKATSFKLGDATIAEIKKYETSCSATVAVKIQTASTTQPTSYAPLTTVGNGTYEVGTDMEPGSYKSDGGKDCYWARMKDDSGRNIIANNLGDGPARFTAKKGEFVKINRCTFTKI